MTGPALPRLRGDVAWHRRPGQPGFLFDARGGGIHALNCTAAQILEGLAGGLDRAAIVAGLVRTHDVEPGPASRDLEAFLERLVEDGLAGE